MIRLQFFILLLLSLQCYSQDKRYSKKELREIVSIQQKQIADLLLKNEELSKTLFLYKEELSKYHIVEQEKFNYLADKNKLEKTLNEKDNEILVNNREKEFLLNLIRNYKKEIEKLNATAAFENKNISEPSTSSFVGKKQYSNSYIGNNKERSRRYITGPRGGCYYINVNGNKTYVDRSLCN